ncbi:MAG: phosphate starvation-inducible protein PhoH, partial [Pseudomonadota bacterium]
MATGALTPPSEAATESQLEFPDNFLLIDLCGEYDRNLTTIEDKLGVQILRRGNQLAVIGEADARLEATQVLGALYSRLEAGRTLEPGDLDRELRMGSPEPADDSFAGDQLEMFRGGSVEIKTRKKLVEPRTDA